MALILEQLAVGLLTRVAGCNSSRDPASTVAATPASTSSAASPDSAGLPGDDEILRQIDDALDYTYNRRRLSVGTTANDQGAGR